MENNSSFFENHDCEYFPCHKSGDKEGFNCLFCFCPLYNISECGGKYEILDNGLKDCSGCVVPHKPENYQYIINRLRKS